MCTVNLKKAARYLNKLEANQVPVELKQSDVKTLLEDLGFDVNDKISGSHIVARHPILAELDPDKYSHEGRLTYPRKPGTKMIKRGYFKNILSAARMVYEELYKERGEEGEADAESA